MALFQLKTKKEFFPPICKIDNTNINTQNNHIIKPITRQIKPLVSNGKALDFTKFPKCNEKIDKSNEKLKKVKFTLFYQFLVI